ncbi:PAS domain S-box protein [Phenylobacterium montanum]|uniref:histidine kinase n=1 Tax=Phenylobacterium montanum TaxID=2823693 RepID=A0A975FXD3_9CAUL|nr:PAS domain S-box protein [Caulobacter sp. S6]QUD86709.1 PAS domain S-box protein [Caulobacter sp. S6]
MRFESGYALDAKETEGAMKADRPDRASRNEADGLIGLFLDTAPDAVVVMDAAGCVTGWNEQAEAVFGWPAAEAVGRELANLIIPAAQRDAHRRGLAHFLATGEGPLLQGRVEVNGQHRSGEAIPVELAILQLGAEGAPTFVGFVRDISERRRAEAALRRQAREAELVNQVTMLAGESGSLEETLPACLSAVCELTGWPAAHAYLPDGADPPRLVSSGIWHGHPETFAPLREITARTAFGMGEGMPGRIWRRRGAYWLPDDGRNDQIHKFPRAQVTRSLGIRATFGFPILIEGEVAAILEFFSQDGLRPDPDLLLTVRTLGEQVGRVLERRRVQRHQALLLAELDHRAMNMLSVVMGMADQTARRARSIEGFRADFTARLGSLARAYGLLTSRGWKSTDLLEIIRQIVGPYVPEGDGRFTLAGEAVQIPPKVGMTLSMVLHELAANATKYGALSDPAGRLAVTVETVPAPEGRRVVLTWRESGLSGVRPPTRRGFGARLIEASLQRELNGTAEIEYTGEGVRYRFDFPERRL